MTPSSTPTSTTRPYARHQIYATGGRYARPAPDLRGQRQGPAADDAQQHANVHRQTVCPAPDSRGRHQICATGGRYARPAAPRPAPRQRPPTDRVPGTKFARPAADMHGRQHPARHHANVHHQTVCPAPNSRAGRRYARPAAGLRGRRRICAASSTPARLQMTPSSTPTSTTRPRPAAPTLHQHPDARRQTARHCLPAPFLMCRTRCGLPQRVRHIKTRATRLLTGRKAIRPWANDGHAVAARPLSTSPHPQRPAQAR